MEAYTVEVDKLTATWFRAKREVTHKSVMQIIGELVREKIGTV
jgi:hypothetical protein